VKQVLILLIVLTLFACGKKGAPYPKDTLDIPKPEAVEFGFADNGLKINNPTDYEISVERAVSEMGDLMLPFFISVTNIAPHSTFVDSSIDLNTRYVYRVRTKHKSYNAYSAPVTRSISYEGDVSISDVAWTINGNKICLDIAATPHVSHVNVSINGRGEAADSSDCYDIPLTARLLLVAVPYSENGIAGRAYSTTIDRAADVLLPPQNVRIIRRNIDGKANVTISWSAAAIGSRYVVTAIEKGAAIKRTNMDNTIYSWQTELKSCVDFELATEQSGKLSDTIKVTSCP
jgi:hypothetical protein